METWKEIKGYEGIYEVSNQGRVRSLDRHTTGKRNRIIKGKVLSQVENFFGYCIVYLCKDGKQKPTRVHRLVAEAFIPNPENKPVVNHKDGNPKNNIIQNLEWCTQAENIQHAHDTGLAQGKPKLSKDDLSYIREKYKPYKYSARKIAKDLGVSESTVFNAIHKRQNYIRKRNYL